ncbi:hypothetical protein [Calothrix sp. 336/3]|uniref:hypothetical protein n=1 Tax=Calothrix sp. 336/3 TaxID=1337936 RepID=UPI0004E44820|nr:hypothetical protein [Calothrix sp. 336/3]AKG20531.1 hypothetical protein IJ00_03660 [Calothrix sp. 336/3]
MVERPIKKSDRQPQADGDSGNSDFKRASESNSKGAARGGDRADRSFGKGRKSQEASGSASPVNPALARPPKQPKPQPKVVAEVEVEEQSQPISEESQDSNHDS